MTPTHTLYDSETMASLLDSLASDIRAAHETLEDVVFVGILSSGFPLAERLSRKIHGKGSASFPVGKLDVALYRDDLYTRDDFVTIRESDIPFSIDNKTLILVDDVLFHGRTIRAALNALLDFGRPKSIELAVLIDRGHRELPIFAHYAAANVTTLPDDRIVVRLLEIEGEDATELIPSNPCHKDE